VHNGEQECSTTMRIINLRFMTERPFYAPLSLLLSHTRFTVG